MTAAIPLLADYVIPAVAALIASAGIWLISRRRPEVSESVESLTSFVYAELIVPLSKILTASKIAWKYIADNAISEAGRFIEAIATLQVYIGEAVKALRGETAYVVRELVNPLIVWKEDVVAWLHNVIEARIITLETWRKDVAAWLHDVVIGRIAALESWRSVISRTVDDLINVRVRGIEEFLKQVATVGYVSTAIMTLTNAIADVWRPIVEEANEVKEELDIPEFDPLLVWWLKTFGDDVIRNLDTASAMMFSVTREE